jgi:protein phosphatase 1G
MGIYLSTPNTEVNLDSGSGVDLSYAAGEMQVTTDSNLLFRELFYEYVLQGWRKTMEDAHIAITDVLCQDQQRISLFAVFDGHGGNIICANYNIIIFYHCATQRTSKKICFCCCLVGLPQYLL